MNVAYVFDGQRIARLDGSPVIRWLTPCAEIAEHIPGEPAEAFIGSLFVTMTALPELAEERAVELRALH